MLPDPPPHVPLCEETRASSDSSQRGNTRYRYRYKPIQLASERRTWSLRSRVLGRNAGCLAVWRGRMANTTGGRADFDTWTCSFAAQVSVLDCRFL